jgi:hypothetical protein
MNFRYISNQILQFLLALQPPWALASDFQFYDHIPYGRTSSTVISSSQGLCLNTIQHKHIHTPNIHALCRIRTHDPGFRASENSACFRPLDYRDRLVGIYEYYINLVMRA